jgi:hypothetical protein
MSGVRQRAGNARSFASLLRRRAPHLSYFLFSVFCSLFSVPCRLRHVTNREFAGNIRMAATGMESNAMNTVRLLDNFQPGLRVPKDLTAPRMSAPVAWQCPAWLDNRPYMLPADDQGQTSTCAAHAMAGLIEAWRWRKTHTPSPVDAFALYAEAKKIDLDPNPGTTFDAVFAAAKSMYLIPANAVLNRLASHADLRFALHRYGVVLVGFNVTPEWQWPNYGGWIASSHKFIGGHGVVACWFDAAGFGFQNSWGKSWGTNGFGRMIWDEVPAQYLDGVAIDIEPPVAVDTLETK